MIDDIEDIEHFQGNPLVKKVGAQIQFTKEQVEEYVKCSQDPFHFIENSRTLSTFAITATIMFGL